MTIPSADRAELISSAAECFTRARLIAQLADFAYVAPEHTTKQAIQLQMRQAEAYLYRLAEDSNRLARAQHDAETVPLAVLLDDESLSLTGEFDSTL